MLCSHHVSLVVGVIRDERSLEVIQRGWRVLPSTLLSGWLLFFFFFFFLFSFFFVIDAGVVLVREGANRFNVWRVRCHPFVCCSGWGTR